MNTYINDVAGEVSTAEAQVVGAFPEDALTEEEAFASMGDDAESPEEALHSKQYAPIASK